MAGRWVCTKVKRRCIRKLGSWLRSKFRKVGVLKAASTSLVAGRVVVGQ